MENYEVLSEIGRGSFGRICKIRRKSDGKVRAERTCGAPPTHGSQTHAQVGVGRFAA